MQPPSGRQMTRRYRHIHIHIRHTQLSVIHWGDGGAVWVGCPTSFFAYCMCESVCLQVCTCMRRCLFALPVDGEPVICFSRLDTHLNKCTHQEMCSKKKEKKIQTVSEQCHFKSHIHPGVQFQLTNTQWSVDKREGGVTAGKVARWEIKVKDGERRKRGW